MTLEELVVKISSDTSGLENGFKKAASTVGKVAAGLTAAAAGATVALAKSAVESYADYEQLAGGVETLFKDSSGKVMEYANNAYKTAGLSANQYMETVTSFSASLLQSVGGDTGKAADAANVAITDMADNANKMGTSMESVQNAYQGFAKQNYTMLDNLKLGYGGTKSEMERLLSDAEKISGVKYDISNLNDVYSAIHVIQGELGITGTTAEEASSTIQGSAAMMKSAWSNMLTGIADDNADFDSLIQNLVDSVGAFAENIIPRVETALKGIGELVTKLAPIIVEAIPGLVDAILPGFIEAITGIVDALLGIIPELLPVLLDAVIQIGMELITSLASILPQLIDAILQGITQIITTITENLPTIIDAIVQGLLGMVQAISDNLPALVTALVQGLITLVQAILDNLPLFVQAFVTLILSFVNAIMQALPQLIAALPTLITSLINGLLSYITQIIQMWITLITSLVQALPTIIQQIVEVLPQIIESIITALLSALPQIIECGIELLIALIEALPQIITTIVAAMPQIITGIINALVKCIPQLIECGVKLFVALIEHLPQIIIDIVKAVPQIIAALVKAFAGGNSDMESAGFNLIKGLFNGISNSVSWLYDKLRGWVSSVLSYIKGLFGIHSPSTVFAGYGRFLEMGLAKGIVDNTKLATDAVAKSAKAVEGAFNPNIEVPQITPTVDKSQLQGITAEATIKPTLTAATGMEVEQDLTLQNTLTNSNDNVVTTLIQVTRQLISAIEDNQTSVSIGDEVIAASAARGNNSYKKRTGTPLLATV